MTYSFSCPPPCRRVILVEAGDADEAVGEIIRRGGLICRNGEYRESCEAKHPQLTPLSHGSLRERIRMLMKMDVPAVHGGQS